jgi:DNA-binding beta-propeller fold protein YncE
MKNYFPRIHLFILLVFFTNFLFAQSLQELEAKRVFLPNGWALTPAGKSLPLGDLPLNMVVSPSGKLIAVTNNGQSDQSVQLFDAEKALRLDSIVVKAVWGGLVFSSDEKFLYASGGNENYILRFAIKNNKLFANDTFRLGKAWPEKISPTGICLDDAKHLLYVVTKENNSLYVLDVNSKKILGHFPLGGEGYSCLLSPDKNSLYISCWGCDKIEIFDTKKIMIAGSVIVGNHPNDMCLTRNGKTLYVANANDNSVSVIDILHRKVKYVLNSALFPDSPPGSTTNSVALSTDEKTLYIANADNNCLAVFDVSGDDAAASLGFIPTGWYPTCVRVTGKNIFVSNGKGFSSAANPYGPNPAQKKEKVNYQGGDNSKPRKVQYIGGLFRGTMSIIPAPDVQQLSIYSHAVYENSPYKNEHAAAPPLSSPIPVHAGDASPIKYVFYIVKENRTYDQVLGDMPKGNGDTSLVLFGKKVTPNQHAIANEFVLYDNFYVDGEVSADGHNWSLGAYATDYLEKTWPTSYGGRGGNYDAEGNRDIANNKNGFIWDFCKRYGVSYRTYGEFADDYKANIPVLKDHLCPYYTSWDQTVRDTTRFSQWRREFDSLLAVGQVPQLNTLRFINDHTEGLSKGRPTPFAHVADNDLAVGMFVDYLSHSSIWKESVVFILEDDAQNGPDHVDAHRSTLYVAGGYVKRGFVEHTMYSTSSVLRTMELILGLPPMSQYDAAATPLWNSFSDTVNATPFVKHSCEVDLTLKNVAVNKWSKKSETFDFTKEDRVPDGEFNEVIWVAVKGEEIPLPASRHAAFFRMTEKDDD